MVHALQEIWRILKPGGFLIDLRPISVDVPLFILTGSGWKSAGLPDQSPDRPHDLASDQALRSVVRKGMFIQLSRKYFEINNYWNSLSAFKADVNERWADDIIVSREIWQQARALLKDRSGRKKVRVPFRKKITLYQKRDHSI